MTAPNLDGWTLDNTISSDEKDQKQRAAVRARYETTGTNLLVNLVNVNFAKKCSKKKGIFRLAVGQVHFFVFQPMEHDHIVGNRLFWKRSIVPLQYS